MSNGFEETSDVNVSVSGVLDKFEGDPEPENLVEKVYIEDGKVVKVETYENGNVVASREVI